MKVTIKSFAVGMEVKTKGIEFDVYSPDGKKHLGDFILTKTGVIWCEGRTARDNGINVKWKKIIEMIEAT